MLYRCRFTKNIIKLISVYGLRRSEALGLCWDKVDFEKNQFTICRAKIQDNGGDYLKDCTKNPSSCRTFPMTSDVRAMFLRLKQQQEDAKRSVKDGGLGEHYSNDLGYVFTWEDGKPFACNYVTSHFHKHIKNSTLPQIRLHDMRHSVASNLLANGFSLVEIQVWLGHSQPSTTLNTYSHADSSTKRNIGNFFEKELKLGE